MPWQILIQIITQKQTNTQTICTKAQQGSVAIDIIQITNQQYLKENNGVNAFLSFTTVILLRSTIKIM